MPVAHVDILMLTDDAPARGHETHTDATGRARGDKRIPADELILGELDTKAETGLEWRGLVIHLVSVERHRGLEAQCVSSTEPAGEKAEPLSRPTYGPPERDGVLCRGVDLIAKLARVAGLGDETVRTRHAYVAHEGVVLLRKPGGVRDSGEDVA